MATADKTFTLTVGSAGGGTTSGTVTLVGTNTQSSIRPAAFFDALWTEVLNGDFGAGTFVPGYGTKGAYVAVGVSGDASPAVFDAVIFDFATNTWTLQANLNGIANSNVKTPVASTSGSPYYEMNGYAGVPCTHQPYRINVGVGTKVIRMIGSCMTSTPLHTPWSHQYDTSTRLWSRLSVNAMDTSFDSNFAIEPCCLYDQTANRIWFINTELAYINRLPYLDLNDNTHKNSASFSAPSGGPVSSNWPHAILHDDGVRRCILVFKTPVFAGTAYPTYASVIDLNNIAGGFTSVTINNVGNALENFNQGTGTFTQAQTSRWAYYPASSGGDGCHYGYDGTSGKVVKLAPPATGITGTWTATAITPVSGSFPAMQRGSGTCGHYTRWMFVPALQCFAWVAGGSAQVALWKP